MYDKYANTDFPMKCMKLMSLKCQVPTECLLKCTTLYEVKIFFSSSILGVSQVHVAAVLLTVFFFLPKSSACSRPRNIKS